MSSITPSTVPVIDFSKQDMKPGSHEWNLVKSQVREALEEYGCFEAMFDRVLEIRKPIIGAMEELFELPLQTKQLCVSNNPFGGYFRPGPGLLETISTDDAHMAENIEQRLTTILWPQGNINFSKTVASFTELVSGLEKIIRRMILESFGVEKYLDELIDSTNYHMRIMKYEAPKTNEPTLRIRAHFDQNMATILYQNEVNGLAIQKKDGEWIDIKPSPNSFVFLTGESLSVWLNGRLSPSLHRVTMMTGNTDRYSLGLFARQRGGFLIKSPQEIADDENGLLFKPYDHDEYLKFFSAQIAKGDINCTLKDYCRV